MTLKFGGWSWKTKWHLLYTKLSFVHHFKSIDEFKLELQSRNAQFGSKSGIFLSRVTLKFNGWPWKPTGYLFYTILSFVHYFQAICEFKRELPSGNEQFGSKSAIFCPLWPRNLTDDLKINGGPLPLHFKLCASFPSHWWIQSGVTVRKHLILIWVKIDNILSCVTL